MKLFALLTAALMTSAGGAYYLRTTDAQHSNAQHSNAECPVAKSGGCCLQKDAPQCCATPCPACATDCRECCDVCEDCCVAGAQVSTQSAKSSCCPSACCEAGEACCEAAIIAVTAGATVK